MLIGGDLQLGGIVDDLAADELLDDPVALLALAGVCGLIRG